MKVNRVGAGRNGLVLGVRVFVFPYGNIFCIVP